MKYNVFFLIIGLLISYPAMSQSSLEKDEFRSEKGPLVITFIGHGTLQIEWNQMTIQVDPWSKLGKYDLLPRADIILITHEHRDHLDTGAIALTRKEITRIIANQQVVNILGEGTSMKNGDRIEVDGIQIEAVPAYNLTPDKQKFHPFSRDNGYILTLGGKRIYIAGDTEDIPEMEKMGTIDIAFLPVNLPYTMTPEQLVAAALKLKPAILYPYHSGNTDMELVKTLFSSVKGTEVRIRKMQ